jgi:hypothetical protein
MAAVATVAPKEVTNLPQARWLTTCSAQREPNSACPSCHSGVGHDFAVIEGMI